MSRKTFLNLKREQALPSQPGAMPLAESSAQETIRDLIRIDCLLGFHQALARAH
jgi:hypothetical protein